MVQAWALDYYLRMDRREYIQDQEDILENQSYVQFAALDQVDRWKKLFGEPDGPIGPDGLPEQPITDPRQLDKWFEQLASQRGMTGAEAEQRFGGDTGRAQMLLGHAEGTGRRV